jgi:hypothetical protein
MNKLQEFIKIADIHAGKISNAHLRLQKIFPITAQILENLSEENFFLLEVLTNRFAKLQDYLASQIITTFLFEKGEVSDNMSMIDKIHKLEKLEIIDEADIWMRMRKTRNHLAHEYPDHPEITAKYLNEIYKLTPSLLNILSNIKSRS